MAQAFLYREKLNELDFKLRQFEAKIDYLSQRLHKTPRQVIDEDLTKIEIDEYEELLSRFEHFKKWEAVDNEFL